MKPIFAIAAAVPMLAGSLTFGAVTPVSIPTLDTVHTEDFSAGTGVAYFPISIVPGLSAYVSGGGTGTNGEAVDSEYYVSYANPQMLNYIRRNTSLGSSQAVSLTDQRLSTINYNATTSPGGYNAAGLSFVNDTGATLTQFHLTYTAFHGTTNNSTAAEDELAFSYAVEAPDLADGSASWTDVPSLSFYGYRDPDTSASSISQTNPTAYVTGLNWGPGEVLTIRWKDTNLSNTDRSLGVDNVVFSIPEPATLAVFGIAGTLLRRRRTA